MSSVTDNKYMDTDSDGNSYRIELTVFNSNANSNTDSNANSDTNSDADCNANSSINCDADSITRSNNAYKAPA